MTTCASSATAPSCPSRPRSSWCWARSSAASPSPARWSPSGKLQGSVPGQPITFPGIAPGHRSRRHSAALAGLVVLVSPAAGMISAHRDGRSSSCLVLIVAAALIFGITMVLPIGGADMPVVISLAQLVHRHGRGNGRLRHRQPGADHRRRAGRRLRRHPDQADGRRHEPLAGQHHGRRLRYR